jgi:hypothetical protein
MSTGRRMKLIVALFVFLGTTSIARADVISVGPGAFPPGTTPITFTGLADGTEINGLTVGGILFNYSLGNGHLVIGGGPGVTNNVNPPNILSVGNPTGILTLTLSAPATLLGYGYAVLSIGPVTNATRITLFNGVTNVGSLAYNGALDPNFAGGFAGIQSTTAFDRVQITFAGVQPSLWTTFLLHQPYLSLPQCCSWLLVWPVWQQRLADAANLLRTKKPKMRRHRPNEPPARRFVWRVV